MFRINQKMDSRNTIKSMLWTTRTSTITTFLALNQFTVIENRVEKRPDVVVFINGLPLVVLELKNPVDENATMNNAFNQIKNYQRAIPSLFDYNAFSVISDGIHAGAGTLTSNEERFSAWKTITGDDKPTGLAVETLIKGMFQKEILLDLIRNFILFQEVGHDSIKILAAYHQYHAVKESGQSNPECDIKNWRSTNRCCVAYPGKWEVVVDGVLFRDSDSTSYFIEPDHYRHYGP
jgi:type I site-specific restriction-modification system R (restriction) subunit